MHPQRRSVGVHRVVIRALVAVALAVSGLALAAVQPAGAATIPTNLLLNGSFESSGHWSTLAPPSGGVVNLAMYQTTNQDSAAYESFGYAEMNTANPGGSIYQDVAQAAVPGHSFTFSMWVRSATGTAISGRVVLWGLGGTTEAGTRTFSAGKDWMLVSTALDPTQGGHSVLRAQLYADAPGNLDADGAQLMEANLANASFETTGGWSTLPPAAGGTVNLATYQDGARSFEATGFAEMNSQNVGGSIYQDVPRASTFVGETFTASLWVRSASGAPFAGRLVIWGLGGTAESFAHPFTAGSGWSLVSTAMTNRLAGNHTSIRVQVYLDSPGNLDVDGAQLMQTVLNNSSFEGDPPLTWVTHASPGGGGSIGLVGKNDPTAVEPSAYATAKTTAAGAYLSQDLGIAPQQGETHTFSVWIRSPSGIPISGAVSLGAYGPGMYEYGTTLFTVGKEWAYVSAAVTPTKTDRTMMRARVTLDTPNQPYDLDASSFASGNARPASTGPGAPTGVTAVAGNAQAQVTWVAPAPIGRKQVTGYTVAAAPGGASCSTFSALTCIVPGLTNGTAYTFTVKARTVMGDGPPSAPSAVVVPKTVPGAPTAVTATPGKQRATVTWSQPLSLGGSPITSYTVTASPGGASCSTAATSCLVSGLTAGVATTFTVRATNAAGTGLASLASPAVVPWSGTTFHPLTPTRLLDSRTDLGGWYAKLVAGTPRALTVTGGSIPSHATAVVMNVTATAGTAGSFLTAFPTGTPVPTASNVNFAAGQTISNLVTVKVGAAGQVSFANAVGSVDVIADAVGYFDDGVGSGDLYNGLTPVRLLDSRTPTGGWNAKLVAGSTMSLTVPVPGGVPATATAVVANVTVTNSTAGSYLKAFAVGAAMPTSSIINFAPGQTISNLAVLPLGALHVINFTNAVGATDVIVDVVGYFDPSGGARFHALAPTRVLDDRVGTGLTGPWGPGQTRSLTVAGSATVPAAATAVVMNATVTNGTQGSFVTVFPDLVARPTTSSVNFGPGQTIPGLVMPQLGTNGHVAIYNHLGSVDVVADLVGYYAPT